PRIGGPRRGRRGLTRRRGRRLERGAGRVAAQPGGWSGERAGLPPIPAAGAASGLTRRQGRRLEPGPVSGEFPPRMGESWPDD
ncbi:MAG: hypothetical protein MUO38_00925, partial [Anaerolineales bacterium]|nr:hypothetical protein [Anaerolineales bacterium]